MKALIYSLLSMAVAGSAILYWISSPAAKPTNFAPTNTSEKTLPVAVRQIASPDSQAVSFVSTDQLLAQIETGDWSLLESYLLSGGDPDGIDSEGRSLLQWAALFGNLEAMQTLIDAGANLNQQDPQGQTPLMAATLQNHSEAMRLLLKNRAQVDLKNDIGESALHLAVGTSNVQNLETLIAAGANIADRFGDLDLDAYLLATNNGDTQMMEHLIQKYPDFINSVDREGRSASHYGCAEGDIDAVATNLKMGGRLDQRDRAGRTAFDYGHDQGSEACIAFVEEAGLTDYL